MKIKSFMLLLLLSSYHMLSAQAISLSPDEFQKKLSDHGVQLLDVRTAGEYQNAHIKNSLQADWNNLEQFKDRAQYLDKNKPILVYCAAGVRSSKAADWLRQNGYTDVEELKGGMMAWKANDKPAEGAPLVKQMTMPDYTLLYNTKDLVLVDFGAEWCPPCKKMEAVLNQLQGDLKGKFTLAKIDAGVHTDIMKEMKVEAIPTFIIYKNGKEVWRKQGVFEIEEFKKQLGSGNL